VARTISPWEGCAILRKGPLTVRTLLLFWDGNDGTHKGLGAHSSRSAASYATATATGTV
jgi:hypothetical protein